MGTNFHRTKKIVRERERERERERMETSEFNA
jgi:hypothetical protein